MPKISEFKEQIDPKANEKEETTSKAAGQTKPSLQTESDSLSQQAAGTGAAGPMGEADQKTTSETSQGRARRRPGRQSEDVVEDIRRMDEEAPADMRTEELNHRSGSSKKGAGGRGRRFVDPALFEHLQDRLVQSRGVQLFRERFPESYAVVEKVVVEWKEDGEFKDLPLKQPLAQQWLSEGLRRAKSVEKKVKTYLTKEN